MHDAKEAQTRDEHGFMFGGRWAGQKPVNQIKCLLMIIWTLKKQMDIDAVSYVKYGSYVMYVAS